MSHLEIKNAIDSLEIYLGNSDVDTVVALDVINSLRKSFERIGNTEWNSVKELSNWFYNEHDPLDIDGSYDLPGVMLEEIRDIMIDIIRFFSPE
jgi:hypothetical protein